jgi:hypothetical protein
MIDERTARQIAEWCLAVAVSCLVIAAAAVVYWFCIR